MAVLIRALTDGSDFRLEVSHLTIAGVTAANVGIYSVLVLNNMMIDLMRAPGLVECRGIYFYPVVTITAFPVIRTRLIIPLAVVPRVDSFTTVTQQFHAVRRRHRNTEELVRFYRVVQH